MRDQQVMSLERAVYRLTGRTALMHDIYDRGFVSAGKIADLVIFDPDTTTSKPREPVNDLSGGREYGEMRWELTMLWSTAPCCWTRVN